MIIFAPKESRAGETRAALTPETAGKLVKQGASVLVEAGLGALAGHADAAYGAAGCEIVGDRGAALGRADLVVRVDKPPLEELSQLKQGAIHVSFLDPFNEKGLVEALAAQGVSAISMELIPRTTLAQKMDALSSQANLAGYVAVLLAAERLPKLFPMMMTPAGTISPARVFVIGAGVAGLQAIATARRLGARVEAFDTRPVVEEQVKSLGARFVKIDLGETGQTEQGYAKGLTEEQQALQRKGMAKICAQSDVVITTAQVFGRKAPRIVTDEMVAAMQPGSVIVDLAAETGGNVEGSMAGEEVIRHGVLIVGAANLPGRVPYHASQMYSANIGSLIESGWGKNDSAFTLNLDDEIIKGCLVTHNGKVVHQSVLAAWDAMTAVGAQSR